MAAGGPRLLNHTQKRTLNAITMNTITLKISRYNPELEKNFWEEFHVPFHKDLTIMEALEYIKGEKSHSLAFRKSCGMGLCGSCGAIVNGKHVLMCRTFCRELKQPVIVEPIKNFPVIKDLVVDTEKAMNKFRYAMPYTDIQNNNSKSNTKSYPELNKTILQTPAERKKIEHSSRCIKCMLCYSACPIFAFNKNFIGPAAAAAAYRYNKDNRDRIKSKRMDSIIKDEGIYKCSFVGECSVVCPKSVDPAGALQKLKMAGVLHTIKKKLK
jgi:fumarate reductase iron-sulfur subunit